MSEINNTFKWVEQNTKQKCSPLARNVCHVLSYMGHGGIYNRPISWDRVDWSGEYIIEVNWGGTMANWDSPDLSALWSWCAELMLRVEICPSSPRHIKLRFWQRKTRDGRLSERLPDADGQREWVGIKLTADTTQGGPIQ